MGKGFTYGSVCSGIEAATVAAAPDLLEALQETLWEYVQLAGCGDCGNWNPEEEPHVIKARAAISQALGGEA